MASREKVSPVAPAPREGTPVLASVKAPREARPLRASALTPAPRRAAWAFVAGAPPERLLSPEWLSLAQLCGIDFAIEEPTVLARMQLQGFI